MIFVQFFSFRLKCCFWVIYLRTTYFCWTVSIPLRWWEEEGGLVEATRWTKSLKEIFLLKKWKIAAYNLLLTVRVCCYFCLYGHGITNYTNNWQLPNNWWQITLVYLGDGMKPSPVLEDGWWVCRYTAEFAPLHRSSSRMCDVTSSPPPAARHRSSHW